METPNIFEQASRQKLRIQTNAVGIINVEDLWDLSMKKLDLLAVDLDARKSRTTTKSFINAPSTENAEVTLQFDLVLHVIRTKQAEDKVRQEANAKATRRKQLLDIRAAKANEADSQKSLEEIDAEINALDN